MNKIKEKTNVMRILDQHKIDYAIHDYSNSEVISGKDVAAYFNENEEKVFIRTVNFFENEISEKGTYEQTKTAFTAEADSLETQTEYISKTLQNVFDFMEAAFGDSQEMVAFITELNANFYSIWFIRENGSDQYYRHNKGLLFDDRQKLILGQMEELENTMKRGLKN